MSIPAPSFDASVVIAGGGPVGVTMAMDLARLGVAAIVLERRRDIPANPRCNTTNARSMELLRRLGCADAVRDVGLPADHNTDVVYMTQLNSHELTRYVRSTTTEVREGRQHDVAANWPTPEPQHFLSQLYLEPVLRAHAVGRYGVDFREGWEFVSFEQDDDGVTTLIRDVDTGEQRTLRSAYLVGAEGSGSVIRKEIGARLEGIPKLGEMCSTFFRSRRVTELTKRSPGWMLRFIGGSTLVAIGADDLWLFHNGVPSGQDPATYDPEPAMFLGVGEPFDYEILGRARWTPRAMVATKFRDRRVFVAGDAAHLWVPMGGFGMNAGIVDAISLSWRIAGVLAGWADDRLLDTYETERAPIGNEVAGQAVTWAIDTGIRMVYSPERLAELDASEQARTALGDDLRTATLSEFECPGFQLGLIYATSPVICHDDATPQPSTSVTVYEETSWPGARLPHVWRADGTSLFDQLGTGFTLLRVGSAAASGDAVIAAAELRAIPLTVLDVTEPEAVDKYQQFGLVLVRPDQHIAWRSRTDPDAATSEEMWATVTGHRIPEPAVPETVASPLVVCRPGVQQETPTSMCWWEDGVAFIAATSRTVNHVDASTAETRLLFTVEAQPAGIGSMPDGRLVITAGRRIYVANGSQPEIYADLDAVALGNLGPFAVDSSGRIYVAENNDGTGLDGDALTARLLRIDSSTHHQIVLDDLHHISDVKISPDGQMLYLTHPGQGTIEQARIMANGDVGRPRPFARHHGSGATIDPSGGIWINRKDSDQIVRYDTAGRITRAVTVPGTRPVVSAIDPTGHRLFTATTERSTSDSANASIWTADLTATH